MKKEENILQNLFLFKGIEQNFETKNLGQVKTFLKNDCIYECNNYKKALGVLLSGKAEALSSGGVALKEFLPSSVFGAAAVFGSSEPYVSRINAKTKCSVLFISEEKLKELFKEYPQTAINYISFLSSKIRFLNQKISLFTADSAESRLYNYLCANQSDEKINMSLLSQTLGIGRTSLYRAMNELEQKNIIVRKDGKVSVLK